MFDFQVRVARSRLQNAVALFKNLQPIICGFSVPAQLHIWKLIFWSGTIYKFEERGTVLFQHPKGMEALELLDKIILSTA